MENQNTPTRKNTEDFITLTDLWHICIGHWKWFVISLIICLSFAAYYLVTTPNKYTRFAAVLVKQESRGKNAGRNVSGEDFNDLGIVQENTNVVNVQRQLVSLDVLVDVVRKLNLAKDPKWEIKVAQSLQSRLKVQIDDEKSTIINMQYSDYSTQRAEQVLNAVILVYNEKWKKNRSDMIASSSAFIDERLRLLENDLGVVDDSISTYKQHHGITDLSRVSDMYLERQSESDAEILRLNNQRSMAQYIYGILKDKSTQHQLLPTNSGINNTVAEAQITQYNNLLLQLKNSLYSTSEQNPLIRKQESDLEDLRKNILSTISNQIKSLDIQLKSLNQFKSEAEGRVSSSPSQAKHLMSVEREQKVKESLYLFLLQKQQENEISLSYSSSNLMVIDMPHGSDAPTSPNSRNVIFAAILLALLLPAIILFVRENINSAVRDRFDIERKTNLSLIGEIPFLENANEKKSLMKKVRKEHLHHVIPLVVLPDKQDAVNEAFRTIRTSLEFMTKKTDGKNVYIVTSGHEGSGKSFVSMNLALCLAIKDINVLFIDGDLRHASSTKHFGCKGKGLADYLGEKISDFNSAIVTHEKYPSLHILPVGTIPPNPIELLYSERFESLIEEARDQYDYILIDCPPAETMADVAIIEKYADRTLFVIRAGLFQRKHLADLEEDADLGKYKQMLVVLNAAKRNDRYAYRYGYKYGYKYGYSYSHQK